MSKSSITIEELMRIVAADAGSASDHVTKIYDWKYAEASTVARSLVGAAFALLLPLLLPVVQPDSGSPLSTFGVWVVIGGSAVLVTLGGIFFLLGRRLHNEYLAAQTLLGNLREIEHFLRLYKGARSGR